MHKSVFLCHDNVPHRIPCASGHEAITSLKPPGGVRYCTQEVVAYSVLASPGLFREWLYRRGTISHGVCPAAEVQYVCEQNRLCSGLIGASRLSAGKSCVLLCCWSDLLGTLGPGVVFQVERRRLKMTGVSHHILGVGTLAGLQT